MMPLRSTARLRRHLRQGSFEPNKQKLSAKFRATAACHFASDAAGRRADGQYGPQAEVRRLFLAHGGIGLAPYRHA